MLLYCLDLLGITALALSTLLIASKNKMDFSKACVLAFVAAIGGGTLRNLLLTSDAFFWINDSASLVVVLFCVSIGQLVKTPYRHSSVIFEHH